MGLRRNKKEGGYTLLELCTVLCLAGILAAVSAPLLGGMGVAGDAASAAETATALDAARSAAVSKGAAVYVSFSNGDMAACWTATCPASGTPTSPLQNSQGTVAVHLPSGVVFTGAPASMTFSADGTTAFSGTIGVGKASVVVDGATGLAQGV